MELLKKYYWIIPIIIILSSAFIFKKSQEMFYEEGLDFAVTIRKVDSIQYELIKKTDTSLAPVTYLCNLYRQVKTLKRPYIFLANSFYSFGSGYALMLVYLSVLTGILAFLLVKRGWDNSDILIKVTFLSLFFCSSVFGLMLNVFKNTENTTRNIESFKKINIAQYELFDFIVRNRKFNEHALDSISNLYGTSIPKMQNYLYDIDVSKIATQNSLKDIN